MDALVDLYPFLLVLLYVLVRALSGRGKKPTPQPNASGPDDAARSPQADTNLDDLTRHLEALMGIAEPPVERREPEPVVESEFRNAEVDVDEASYYQHESHGFGRENPISEEVFESRPAFTARPSLPEVLPDPHALRRKRDVAPTPASPWKQRLSDPKRAREAFVLQTILERPSERRR